MVRARMCARFLVNNNSNFFKFHNYEEIITYIVLDRFCYKYNFS